MGFSISWIGVRGADAEALLAALGLTETGREVGNDDLPRFAVADLPSGWRIIYSDDVAYASPERIAAASLGGEAVGVCIEEHVMQSSARRYVDGREVWSILHDPQTGRLDHLVVAGAPPAEFEPLRAKALEDHTRSGGEASAVDYIFDIPVTLAETLCGYRIDEVLFEPPGAVFYELKGKRSRSRPAPPPPPSGPSTMRSLGAAVRKGLKWVGLIRPHG